VFYAELGQMTTIAGSMFPLYLLSGFGSGVISVMNYGKNIADIPNTLVTSQFTNVAGIKLNEEFARKDYAAMNKTFLGISKLMVFILVPLGCFMFVFAEPIVELFYNRGNFTQEAVTESAKFMQLLSITIFSIGVNAAVTRVFIAIQAIKQPFFYQLVLNIFLIAAIWICTRYYGAYGYPYAIIIMNLVNFITMYFICRKLIPQINYVALLKYTGLIILINAAIATGLFFAVNHIQAVSLVKVIPGFLLYLIILLMLNKKFALNTELTHILKHVKQKFY
jgi:putative peptidoglycan lipid II flippase